MAKKYFSGVNYWLLIIIIIATFLRFYQITVIPPGLYPDEAMNGNNALEALSTRDFKVFYPENNGREGLLINMQAILMGALHRLNLVSPVNQPWVLRLPSAFFGVLTIVGLYFLTRELSGSKKLALFAAFLMATGFWHINFSRIGFRAILSPFFLVWTVYLLLLSYQKLSEGRRRLGVALPLLAGALYGLGFYTYIAYRATPILLAIFILAWLKKFRGTKEKLRDFWHATGHFLFAAILVALPIGIYFLHHPSDFFGRSSEISIFNSATPLQDLGLNILKTLGQFNISGDGNWRHNIAGQPLLFWPVGIMFLVGFAVAIKRFRFPVWWFLIAGLPVVISDEGIPHALRSILMAPAVYMLAAIGGLWLYELMRASKIFRSPMMLIMFVAALLGLLTLEAYASYFIIWGHNKEVQGAFAQNYVDIARDLNAIPHAVPKYVMVQAGGVAVRGIPVPAQTVMFLTNTFLPANQQAKNIHYVLPTDSILIPPRSYVAVIK